MSDRMAGIVERTLRNGTIRRPVEWAATLTVELHVNGIPTTVVVPGWRASLG